MASETDPVLARIQAKIDAWQAAAATYRAALALEHGADAEPSVSGNRAAPIELPVNAFRGVTITEAVKLYLQSVRRKQTVQEIADGLKAGGIESTSKKFAPTIRSILHNLKKKGDVLRFKDGWDLADAHSTALRSRLAKDTTTTKPAKGRKKKAGRKANGQKADQAKPSGPKGPSIDERVQAFLAAKPLEWFTAKEVADGLKESDMKSMGLAFARLVRYGRVAKQADGRFAAVRK